MSYLWGSFRRTKVNAGQLKCSIFDSMFKTNSKNITASFSRDPTVLFVPLEYFASFVGSCFHYSLERRLTEIAKAIIGSVEKERTMFEVRQVVRRPHCEVQGNVLRAVGGGGSLWGGVQA